MCHTLRCSCPVKIVHSQSSEWNAWHQKDVPPTLLRTTAEVKLSHVALCSVESRTHAVGLPSAVSLWCWDRQLSHRSIIQLNSRLTRSYAHQNKSSVTHWGPPCYLLPGPKIIRNMIYIITIFLSQELKLHVNKLTQTGPGWITKSYTFLFVTRTKMSCWDYSRMKSAIDLPARTLAPQ